MSAKDVKWSTWQDNMARRLAMPDGVARSRHGSYPSSGAGHDETVEGTMHKSEVPYLLIPASGPNASPSRWLCATRYGNANGFAWGVVAVLNFYPVSRGIDPKLFDWTVYMGGCDLTNRKRDTANWIARYGNKMPAGDAHYFFPSLPFKLYCD